MGMLLYTEQIAPIADQRYVPGVLLRNDRLQAGTSRLGHPIIAQIDMAASYKKCQRGMGWIICTD